ncbi:MAG: helix-turn-helix domain-containing protein [Allorhizobium sp.]
MTTLANLKKDLMLDPEFRAEYAKADADYSLIETLIRARTDANLTQADIAKRIGTTQSAIARLESGNISPSLSTLSRYAAATGRKLQIQLAPLDRS